MENDIDNVQKKAPVVVEFFGLPGAGKTTIYNILSSELQNDGHDIAHRIDFIQWHNEQLFMSKLTMALNNPMWLWHCIKHCLAGSSELVYEKDSWPRILRTIFKDIYIKEYISHCLPGIVMFDQLTIQNIWSTWAGKKHPSRKLLRDLVSHIDLLLQKKYVYCKIGPEKAKIRISNRTHGGSRFDKLSLGELETAMQDEYWLMEYLHDAVVATNCDILVIDSLESPEKNSKIIKRWLNISLD